MNKLILNNTFRFVVLVLLQVLVLNKVNLFGYLNPMVYIVWVFLFPVRKNKTTFLILSFLLGLTIDSFSDSGGIHAAATLFIAFYRLSRCQDGIICRIYMKSQNSESKFDLLALSCTFVLILNA